MTVSTQKKVRLKVTELTFVSSEAEAEAGPKVRSLVVSREIFQRAAAWAEALGWKNPDRSLTLQHLPRPAVLTFVKTLRGALEAEPTVSSTSKERMHTRTQLAHFFAVAGNRRQLNRVLDFLAPGGEMTVEDA